LQSECAWPKRDVVTAFWGSELRFSSYQHAFSPTGLLFCFVVALSGCAAGVPDPGLTASTGSIDPIRTASINANAIDGTTALNPDLLLDAEAMSKVVSAVPFSGKPLPWENSATGSEGEISSIVDSGGNGRKLCREFSAFRQSYDGARNYIGKTCLNDAGHWALETFTERQ
jgi:hypothetical protein